MMNVTMQTLENLLTQMTNGEKAQALQWFARDLGGALPGIEKDARVCGGSACIVRTRIPIWLLEQSRRLGISESEILQNYPMLRAEDLSNAWAFVRSHQDEINTDIKANEES